jgi:hypothetical protein
MRFRYLETGTEDTVRSKTGELQKMQTLLKAKNVPHPSPEKSQRVTAWVVWVSNEV